MKKIILIFSLLLFINSSVNADIANPRVKSACIDKTGKIVTCSKYYENAKTNTDILYEYRELVLSGNECREQYREDFEKARKTGKNVVAVQNKINSCRDKYLSGFKDKDGNIVIKAKFDGWPWVGRYVFIGDTTPVRKDGKWGVINKKGNWVVKPQFDLLMRYSEGLAGACKDGRCGYIDEKGKWVIQPQDINFMCFTPNKDNTYWYNYKCHTGSSQFSEGLAAVYYDKCTKSGYIDKTGKLVIKDLTGSLGNFSEGLAAVISKTDYGYRYGYINKNGEFIIKPMFYEAHPFINGFAFVEIDKSQSELNKEYEKVFKDYKKHQEERLKNADKEEQKRIKENLKNTEEYLKHQYKIKSDNKPTRNTAYADVVERPANADELYIPQEKRTDNNKTIVIFSIVLLGLIIAAGFSIRRTIKKNDEHKDN